METLEASRVCRLCGNHSGISINIFDKKENHVRKINAVLPIMVHEMDLLPKHMCHRCSYKLEEFHKFYIDCLKTDANLKSQLSWMRKERSKEKIGVPMVHIENIKIKVESPDYDVYDLEPLADNVDYINAMNSVGFPVNSVQASGIHNEITYATYGSCNCCYDKDQSSRSISHDYRGSLGKQTQDDIGSTSKNASGHSNHQKKDIATKDTGENSQKTVANSHNCLIREKSLLRGKVRKKVNIDVQNSCIGPLVRNLRHRKYLVRSFDEKRSTAKTAAEIISTANATVDEVTLPVIKAEKNSQSMIEGRTLRPRKRTIDYLGRKKRNRVQKNTIKLEPIFDDEESNSKRQKLAQLERSSKNEKRTRMKKNMKFDIKQEIYDSIDNVRRVNDISVSKKSNSFGTRPKKVIADTNVNTKPSHLQNRNIFQVINELKSIKKVTKNKLRSMKTIYSEKCLRSHDSYLRNGKILSMSDVGMKIGIKRLQRNLRYRGIGAQKLDENMSMKKISSASVNLPLVANCIKHYCEKCSLSFFNKELFKLHACYD